MNSTVLTAHSPFYICGGNKMWKQWNCLFIQCFWQNTHTYTHDGLREVKEKKNNMKLSHIEYKELKKNIQTELWSQIFTIKTLYSFHFDKLLELKYPNPKQSYRIKNGKKRFQREKKYILNMSEENTNQNSFAVCLVVIKMQTDVKTKCKHKISNGLDADA